MIYPFVSNNMQYIHQHSFQDFFYFDSELGLLLIGMQPKLRISDLTVTSGLVKLDHSL